MTRVNVSYHDTRRIVIECPFHGFWEVETVLTVKPQIHDAISVWAAIPKLGPVGILSSSISAYFIPWIAESHRIRGRRHPVWGRYLGV